ncbi:MAG: hypothetical protein LQ350_006571 [Teloschistes chrysophthalmus]|nr:MAG: hypothetical protein LQ350_006571 [Niorma chrysophthalma]
MSSTEEVDAERSKQEPAIPTRPAHQRFVFTDPAAFRYLEEDPSTTVLGRHRRLHGYELYFIEQWACSRVHPTFVITTYTGLEQHSILVSVLSVPTDEEAWSPRLRVYFKAISKYHARKKETPLGTLMVTNLSGFPSALTVILVPDGDLRKHREDFIVNENLKRMGCTGRTGLNLSHPVQATEAKFYRLYHTSDRIPLYRAVIELVKLCQAALVLFGKLAPEYADGLLCDVTEQAINEWWNDIGAEIYNVEPSDGILGPTTVAALIGLLIGSRNRLHAYGAPVAKDAYDLAATKRAVAYFQKSQKVEKRTRRLDRPTLKQLHRATNKAARSSEGWNVPRAVKSTMAELSGKGNELAAGEAREKAGIADIETLDIDTFVQLTSGERCKWLWYGKPRKSDSDVFKQLGGDDGMVLENDDHGGYVWSKQQRDSVIDDHSRFGRTHTHTSQESAFDGPEKDQVLRRTVLKSVAGRMTDARSGFGRIRDAVGMRGHHHRHSKEAASFSDAESLRERPPRFSYEQVRYPATAGLSQQSSSIAAEGSGSGTPSSPRSRRNSELHPDHVKSPEDIFRATAPGYKYAPWEVSVESESEEQHSGNVSDAAYPVKSLKVDEASTHNLDPKLKGKRLFPEEQLQPLQRTQSLPSLSPSTTPEHHHHRWPRHLSFSIVVDVLSASDSLLAPSSTDTTLQTRKTAATALQHETSLLHHIQQLSAQLSALQSGEAPLVSHRVNDIEAIDAQRSRDQEVLSALHRQQLEEHEGLQDAASALLAEEKARLAEAGTQLETLGQQLEYEIKALEGKVEDVEMAVEEFERQVVGLEGRAGELCGEDAHGEKEKGSWVGWFVPWKMFGGS